MTDVAIIRTGAANLASVQAAFERLGVQSVITDDARDVRAATAAVLPGVGAFGPTMARLQAAGLDDAIAERVSTGAPLLAICLGFQLLFDESDEAPGVTGLGLARGKVSRFTDVPRVPQLGWNRVTAPSDAAWLRDHYAYFANSFRVTEPPPGWRVATSPYGGEFVAAIERDGVLACQFHPELSGPAGSQLLARWVASASIASTDLEVETC